MYDTVFTFFYSQDRSSVNSSAEPNKRTKAYSHLYWDIGNNGRVGPVRTYLSLAEDLEKHTSYQIRIRQGPEAIGVEVETDDGVSTLNLNSGCSGGKVIHCSCWCMGNPLHPLSGIGPVEQVQNVANCSTGVTLPPKEDWIDLPVGQNMKDHPIFTFCVQNPENWTAFDAAGVINGTDAVSIELYEKERSGVLAQIYHRIIFWDSNVAPHNITRYYQGFVSPQGPGIFLIEYLMHGATSSGTMGISSNGTVRHIKKPYLTTAGDKEAVSIWIEKMPDTISSYLGWSMAKSYDNVSYVLSSYTQGNYYLVSANLGTDCSYSVVSMDDVKAWGTGNLYVVDSSIHADLPTSNTQAITTVIAEKTVEKIIAAEINT